MNLKVSFLSLDFRVIANNVSRGSLILRDNKSFILMNTARRVYQIKVTQQNESSAIMLNSNFNWNAINMQSMAIILNIIEYFVVHLEIRFGPRIICFSTSSQWNLSQTRTIIMIIIRGIIIISKHFSTDHFCPGNCTLRERKMRERCEWNRYVTLFIHTRIYTYLYTYLHIRMYTYLRDTASEAAACKSSRDEMTN